MANKDDINDNSSDKLWGGRFASNPAQLMEIINQSISFDQMLYPFDIHGSIVHSEMLTKQGIITEAEGKKIQAGLEKIGTKIDEDKFDFDTALEDIHMNIEAALTKDIGAAGGKLHTARSRNDQVATDFKLFVRTALANLQASLLSLQDTLLNKAEEHYDTIMPGFTHLQTAQPVTFGHHLLAYFDMFERDINRVVNAYENASECPLGAAALAGTSFPIDRHYTAEQLGFDGGPTTNSLDSVSDRDFAIEYLSTVSILAMHLSRFAEEMVIWCSHGFRFISFTDQFSSGSSIMPQKRNPDAAELIRAKTGRIFGALTSLLTVMKGLPLTYSKDMQEDKEPVFDAANAIILSVEVMHALINDMVIHKENMLAAAKEGFSTATDLADWLVQTLNIPFRESHHITGQIVKLAEEKNCHLDDLTLDDLQSIEPQITKEVFDVL